MLFALGAAPSPPAATPLHESRLIFPPQAKHNHGSCIVECPNGDLLAVWYRGSGERSADDVEIVGARLRKGSSQWSDVFPVADTPGFPDCNPCMIVDRARKLWMFWPVILDNHWESALLKCRTSRNFTRSPGAPTWEWESVVLLKPGPEFADEVNRHLDERWAPYRAAATSALQAKLDAYLAERRKALGDKLKVRLGWMPRPHPFITRSGRLLVGLYSDGWDFSMMAYTDDDGATWKCSSPIVGPGNVQPSIVQRKDGTLVAYFRDNGPPPQRVMASESTDDGQTWSAPIDTDRPDPGAGLEVIALRSGRWLLINNNTEDGRHRLSISISEDEGRTWPKVVPLEDDPPGAGAGSYSYPSILQAKDGTIHITYSYSPNQAHAATEGQGESIKYVRINEAWLLR